MYLTRASSLLRASSLSSSRRSVLSLSSPLTLTTAASRQTTASRQLYTLGNNATTRATRTTTLPNSTKWSAQTISRRGFLQTAGVAMESAISKTGEKLGVNASLAKGIAAGLALAGFHSATGSANEFYEYRFPTKKSADDLASFFGGETFMELYCVFPFVGVLMMRMGYFDDEGNVITQGVPGTMKVSMVFSDETNEETGETDWFNKRERFRNMLWGYDCWDMMTNFGFRTLEDGTREVYLEGEYFHGNLPVVSQIMRLVFTVHARWLAWSAEHHINHFAFTAGNEREEHMEEESRNNMPMFLLKHYAFSDLLAMLFGYDLNKSTSFLILKMSMVGLSEEEDEDEDEDEDEEEDEEEETEGVAEEVGEDDEEEKAAAIELSFQNHRTLMKRRASMDIEFDKDQTKQLLARHRTSTSLPLTPQDKQVLLARRTTLKREEHTGAYDLAREAAHERLMVRRATLRALKELSSKEGGSPTESPETPSVVKEEQPVVSVPLAAAA